MLTNIGADCTQHGACFFSFFYGRKLASHVEGGGIKPYISKRNYEFV